MILGLAVAFVALGFALRFWNQRKDARLLIAEKDEKLAEFSMKISDLLIDNELTNKECEQNHRIVIEAAKEERLKMIADAAEYVAFLDTMGAQLAEARKSLDAQRKRTGELVKDVEDKCRMIRQLVASAEMYRSEIKELREHAPARGGNGRFARRQVAG